MKFIPSKSNRRVFGQLASGYDLVYFGHIDRGIADYQPIGGITLTRTVRDENYTVGDVYEYPVRLVERSTMFKIGGRRETHHWTILEITLRAKTDRPRMVVLGWPRMTDYAGILTEGAQLKPIAWPSFGPTGSIQPDFAQSFGLYARAEQLPWLTYMLAPSVQAMLATYFTQFDYEIIGDTLLIYSTAPQNSVTLAMLDLQLRVGLWWARELDSLFAPASPDSE
jgi:hypothetical protein